MNLSKISPSYGWKKLTFFQLRVSDRMLLSSYEHLRLDDTVDGSAPLELATADFISRLREILNEPFLASTLHSLREIALVPSWNLNSQSKRRTSHNSAGRSGSPSPACRCGGVRAISCGFRSFVPQDLISFQFGS